jgi:hypothetical protein
VRYVYLGDKLTDPALVGRACDPVRRADGKCIVGRRTASALVVFERETEPRVVLRRRLRVVASSPDSPNGDLAIEQVRLVMRSRGDATEGRVPR